MWSFPWLSERVGVREQEMELVRRKGRTVSWTRRLKASSMERAGVVSKAGQKAVPRPRGGPAVLLKFEFPRPLVLRAPEAGIAAGLLKPAQAILALQIGGQG